MRLNEYLIESTIDTWGDIETKLNRNCKKFMDEKVMLFRGTKNKNVQDIGFFTPRTNRRPLDSPRFLHVRFNKASKKIFGWKARSEGVLVTGDKSTANSYGDVNIFIPKGDYQYIWAPKVKDLFYRYKSRLQSDPNNTKDEFWEDFVNKEYQKHGLKEAAHSRAMEIMFHCPNGYYLIDPSFEDDIRKEFKTQ